MIFKYLYSSFIWFNLKISLDQVENWMDEFCDINVRDSNHMFSI